jgi:hypothetical protein
MDVGPSLLCGERDFLMVEGLLSDVVWLLSHGLSLLADKVGLLSYRMSLLADEMSILSDNPSLLSK